MALPLARTHHWQWSDRKTQAAANARHNTNSMLKHQNDGLSKSWAVSKRQGAAYTGGCICVVDQRTMACLSNDRVALLDVQTGLVSRFFPPDDEVRVLFLVLLL